MASVDGTATFMAGSEQHTLRYGINALCRLEDRLSTNVMALGQRMAEGLDVRTLRTVFACGLDGGVADDAAGEVMDAIGLDRAGALVGEAFQAAFPSAAEAAPVDGGASRPRKPAPATGSAG